MGWAELNDQQRAPYIDAAPEMLADLLFCTRDWSAWSYGTMRKEDFIDASCDDDIIEDMAKRLYEFCTLRTTELIKEVF